MTRYTALMFLVASMTLLLSGCPETGPVEMDCVAGQACECEAGDCTVDCPDGNCAITCEEGTTCDASCDGGACAMTCTDAVSCILDCAGDACGLDCSGDDIERCEITSCGATCALDCGGAEACENSCDPIDACTTVP